MVGHRRTFTTEASSFRLGRIADDRDKSRDVRFWLQAVGQHIANNVGLTPSSGHSGSGVAHHAILATNGPMSGPCQFRPVYPQELTLLVSSLTVAYDPNRTPRRNQPTAACWP